MEKNLVWESKLDGRFQCEVERTGERAGVLKVYDEHNENKEVFSKEVGLSYGAIFGPDVDDVALWENIVVDFVDNELT